MFEGFLARMKELVWIETRVDTRFDARFQDPAASVGATTIRFGDLHRCPSIIQPPSDARGKYSDKPRASKEKNQTPGTPSKWTYVLNWFQEKRKGRAGEGTTRGGYPPCETVRRRSKLGRSTYRSPVAMGSTLSAFLDRGSSEEKRDRANAGIRQELDWVSLVSNGPWQNPGKWVCEKSMAAKAVVKNIADRVDLQCRDPRYFLCMAVLCMKRSRKDSEFLRTMMCRRLVVNNFDRP